MTLVTGCAPSWQTAMQTERAYKRLLRWLAEQPGGEGELFSRNNAVPYCVDRGLVEVTASLGWVVRYRITDAGRAEIADA